MSYSLCTSAMLLLTVNLSFGQRVKTATIDSTYQLIWSDEFNVAGKPTEKFWMYEQGFTRNEELQWYQAANTSIKKGILTITGRREKIENLNYQEGSDNWRLNRKFADYSAASIKTKGKFSFQYGILEVRARIDTSSGMWPAIWTLGDTQKWPACGEVDLMEFYRVKGQPTILANAVWANAKNRDVWNSKKIPYTHFSQKDKNWHKKFHTWKMDWTPDFVRLYLDDELLNEIDLSKTINPDGFNPFHQPHYILLNLAIGANGGDPGKSSFPRKYEVDYVRVYQHK